VAYGAQTTDGEYRMPEGVSQRFTAGEVLLVQTHYLNTTTEAVEARIDFTFHTVPVEQAPTEAGVLFFFNPVINVPPNGSATAELSCPLPADVNLLFASSHMHKRGVGFEAHKEGDARGSLYTSDAWADPIPRVFTEDGEGAIPAGSAISYRCEFQNDRADTVMVGPRADEDEMCMFIGMYYPKLDDDTELCTRGAAVTKGTLSCFDAIGCAGACVESDTTCRAGCLEQVCPTAAVPMMQFLQCFGPACGETCQAVGRDDPACTSCVTSKCLDQASACNSAACPAP
jgi:Copper type II ascorbate-dependent monooxygenase, C-terminal domain